jgi:signal transduction histidine kinase
MRPTSSVRSRAKPGSGRWLLAAQVGQFALAGLVALAIVGLATAVASRRVGEREAVSDARTTTVSKAKGLVEPAIKEGLLHGDPTARAELDDVVQHDVLDHRNLLRVKLWTKSGRIIYSDEKRLVDQRYTLGEDEKDAIATGRIVAEVSDLNQPENRYERALGQKLLEVYLPVHSPNGTPLLFEGYYTYDSVSASGSRLWRSFAPITLGALVALELVQIPLAYSLARRLRLRQLEREALLQRAIDASEVERRQIASDLHDGVVQDLAGVAYGLSAAARDERAADGAQLEQSAETVRESVRALRSLIVDLYPPNLREEGLESALQDLTDRARERGVPTSLDVDEPVRDVPDRVAGLLYRSAQEGLRNVVDHAQAKTARLEVSLVDHTAMLELADDGRGFDEQLLAERVAAGHVGLKALRGLLSDAGGSLEVDSRPGEGTTMRVRVPLS